MSVEGLAEDLFFACKDGDLDAIKRCAAALAALGEGVNAKHHGVSALSVAAAWKREECVKWLLEAKADVNTTNSRGCTPIYTAQGPCIELLVDAKADLCWRDEDGRTPLHHAALGTADRVRRLIAARANVNAADNRGGTPLLRALAVRVRESAEWLLDAGAKLEPVYRQCIGCPAWAFAIVRRRQRCREAALTLYGILRKRLRGVSRDMIGLLTRALWDTRLDAKWGQESEFEHEAKIYFFK